MITVGRNGFNVDLTANTRDVSAVLLPDGWHDITVGTFQVLNQVTIIDDTEDNVLLFMVDSEKILDTCFKFVSQYGHTVVGPCTSILSLQLVDI